MIIKPQPGPQEKFLSSPADIAIYGGAAGGGKTYALLMECARHVNNKSFRAVIFRRVSSQITNPGGLYDTALELYPGMGARALESPKIVFKFPSGAKVIMTHMQYDKDALGWQGSQVPLICYDELTHFTEKQFFYLVSRSRNSNGTAGIKPYIRATCNPDPDSFVADLISWWIDSDTGLAIPERSGVMRWFIRVEDEIIWAGTKQELIDQYGSIDENGNQTCMPKSFAFIASSVYDNKILLRNDPGYLANLKAMNTVDREQLLNGNWKIKPSAGLYFKAVQAPIVETIPGRIVAICRAWDLAATESTPQNKDPDRTRGVLMARLDSGKFIVVDGRGGCLSASDVRILVRSTGSEDVINYKCNTISIPQDPGQAGKEQAQSYVQFLSGHIVKTHSISGNKIARAEPLATQWQQGNVLILRGPWNKEYLREMESFPDGAHDDYVDASSDSFSSIAKYRDLSGAIN